ncbi:hypothetical protein OG339_47255 (plasmid) [Streptosporangium sp. NBC_01495]|uniref:hypothetical protein n=1 Tax=Streptosporangium sp. NBC_01495 TaxID=2903899 RepID=UPI002E2F1BB1|nr:hypothetical protein [Streptosporangium sp. NBC_01495]
MCPEHGNTLISSAGRTGCRVCPRTWEHDRQSLPCPEPVRWVLVDQDGVGQRVCDGHAVAAGVKVSVGVVHKTLAAAAEGNPTDQSPTP